VRAIGHHKFVINFRQDTMDIIEWTSEYKYLGYIISPKLGWVYVSSNKCLFCNSVELCIVKSNRSIYHTPLPQSIP
ncbi:unnamed protein product, partial [Rotaria magnacalcarata]